MQIALFIYYTSSWQRLANLVLPIAKAYCERHGYAAEFICEAFYGVKENNGQLSQMPVGYYKMLKLRELLDKYEFIWVLDCDTLITNIHIPFMAYVCNGGADDLFFTHDVNGLNAGSFIIRSNKRSKKFIQAVIDNFDAPEEQSIMKRFLHLIKPWRLHHPSINSYPYAEYTHDWERLIGEHEMPIHEQGNWQPGDLLLHLPGLDMNTRINIIIKTIFDVY